MKRRTRNLLIAAVALLAASAAYYYYTKAGSAVVPTHSPLTPLQPFSKPLHHLPIQPTQQLPPYTTLSLNVSPQNGYKATLSRLADGRIVANFNSAANDAIWKELISTEGPQPSGGAGITLVYRREYGYFTTNYASGPLQKLALQYCPESLPAAQYLIVSSSGIFASRELCGAGIE